MVLLAAVEASSKLEEAIRSLVEHGSQLGFTIIKALIVFLVGRLVINLLNKLVRKILSKRDIDPSVKTFVGSLVNVSLTIDYFSRRGVRRSNYVVCRLVGFRRCRCRYGIER